MGKIKLDLDDEEGDGDEISVNTAYAQRYDNWRRLEEMQKVKDKYGTEADSDEESVSSEEPADWSADHEKDFLSTLAALKTRDPRIYSDEKFFTAQPSSSTAMPRKEKKNAPMFLKDYERKLVLEKGGDISDDDQPTAASGYFQHQESIKNEIKQALLEHDTDEGALLTRRVKTEKEIEKEHDQYYAWLKGQKTDAEADAKCKHLKGLRELWSNPDMDKDDQFLRDYLLNRDYETAEHADIPMYDQVVKDVEDDESELQRERDFEKKFNFRFEEADQEFIKQYPRTVKESLRKVDDKRKDRRDAYKARKEEEKREKKDQIRELKAMKRSAIEDKLERLRKMAGDDELAVRIEDLEEDFDPATYDQRMQQLFDQQYYGTQHHDEDKPVFSESEHSDDESDYDNLVVSAQTEQVDREPEEVQCRDKPASGRKKKRNSKFLAAVSRKKPVFNPDEKTFEEYFNEYYALDYEDIIGGGITTKFKYRAVPANNYGLSTNEILNADDRQLNAWASLKKATAYKSEQEERYDQQAYLKKAADLAKKTRIFNTDYGGKRSINMREQDESTACVNDSVATNAKRKRKHATSSVAVDDERLRAYGVNPRKFKNKRYHRQRTTQD